MGVINPDPSFMRELKGMDPKLGCHFNDDISRFVVTYERSFGPPACIMTVKTEDGEFRHPDNRDLVFIKSGDMNNTSVAERMAKTAKYMEDYRAKLRRDHNDNIRNMTKDNKIQLSRQIAKSSGQSSGKYDPFRKTPPTATGKVF